MSDALAVQVSKNLNQLLDQSLGFFFRKCLVIQHSVYARFLSLQMFMKAQALDVFHNDVHKCVGLECFGKLHYILVA